MRHVVFLLLALAIGLSVVARAEETEEKSCCNNAACCKAACPASACAKQTACAKEACAANACCTNDAACAKAGGCRSKACAKADCCQANACVASGCCRAGGCAAAEKIEHLQQALAHLEAAGRKSEAQAVHKALVQELLALKVAELHRLQAEVDELRKLADGKRQVKLHLKLMEVPLSEIQAEGIAVPGSRAAMVKYMGLFGDSKPVIAYTTCDHEAVSKFVESLREKKRAKFLAETTLVTVDGRPCTYVVAGAGISMKAARPSIDFQLTGTKVDAQVDVLDDHKVRLSVEPKLGTLEAGKPIPPGLSLLFVDVPDMARVIGDFRLGESVIINGPIHQRTAHGQTQEVQTLLVVTPEVASAGERISTARAASKTPAK